MFTSRAEYRLHLRQDNADARLTKIGHELGLAEKSRLDLLNNKISKTEKIVSFIKKTSITPDEINILLNKIDSSPIKQKKKISSILSRPHVLLMDIVNYSKILKDYIKNNNVDSKIIEQAEIIIKYSGYLNKQKESIERANRLEKIKIAKNFEYSKLHSISSEAKEKLNNIKPMTIGQASRISGVSPADINVLLVYLGR
tara:strand:+ start:11 stop:607 length:597 start_codon:yes stop_codon:yes gene_type:complete